MPSLLYLYSKFIKKYLRGKSVLNSRVDSTAAIYSGTEFYNSSIGRYSYVGYDSQVHNCEIGNFCSIANNFIVGSAEHPITWVSTSPVFQDTPRGGPRKRFSSHPAPKPVLTKIGHDVWIGINVVVKQGVTIGNGAVIGSGAVVTKDVPAYAIVAGVPAKIIRYRFDEDTILDLEESKWWELDDDNLTRIADFIPFPEKIIRAIKNLNNNIN